MGGRVSARAQSREAWGGWRSAPTRWLGPLGAGGRSLCYENDVFRADVVWYDPPRVVLIPGLVADGLIIAYRRPEAPRCEHHWREMQRIKDALAGEARAAVEFYPPRAEVFDNADQYYLHILPQRR